VVKGAKGSLAMAQARPNVNVSIDERLPCDPARRRAEQIAMAGTLRALVANMVVGVSDGFERKLDLVGVGYRAQAQGDDLNLTLGFSHPVEYFSAPGRHHHRDADARRKSW
jgi:large subunit ribosomal protein L6